MKELAERIYQEGNWTLFLDRDGVINTKLDNDYVKTPEEFDPLPHAYQAIALLNGLFKYVVVVTNQQGVGKRLMTVTDLENVHSKMLDGVADAGAHIDKIYYCPDLANSGSENRKPLPGMAFQARKDFPEIDFSRSVMVGDSVSDMQFGEKTGMVNVRIAQGKADRKTGEKYRFDSLSTFASSLLNVLKTKLSAEYWNERYELNNIPWDAGGVTTPIKEYIDQLEDKSLKILVPGAGNSHEVAYLHVCGFEDVTVLDWAETAISKFLEDCREFPAEKTRCEDFFEHKGKYDLILEQTFFCALHPSERGNYVQKMSELLVAGGKLVGLLFDFPLSKEGPPFGGSIAEYEELFKPDIDVLVLERAYNSIKPRVGSELFLIAQKKGLPAS